MANPKWQGVSSDTENRMIFDAGALYRDYGETGEQLIGATRGGAAFSIDREDREVEVDGTYGPTKGLRRVVRYAANLEVTFVELSLQTFLDIIRGTSTSDGTHETITPDVDIVSGDFYTNIALVADVSGSSDPAILKLKNALVTNEWDITTGDDDEGELSLTFEAHYDASTLDEPPFEVLWPTAAS